MYVASHTDPHLFTADVSTLTGPECSPLFESDGGFDQSWMISQALHRCFGGTRRELREALWRLFGICRAAQRRRTLHHRVDLRLGLCPCPRGE